MSHNEQEKKDEEKKKQEEKDKTKKNFNIGVQMGKKDAEKGE
jgi:hypothetical protein